jgi:hypothetical protein
MDKTDLSITIGILGLLAGLGVSPALLVAASMSFLVGRLTR